MFGGVDEGTVVFGRWLQEKMDTSKNRPNSRAAPSKNRDLSKA